MSHISSSIPPIQQRFLQVIKSSQFESAVDVILALNAVVVTIQSWPLLVGNAVALNETYLDGTFFENMPWLPC
jgi:hypothetical protein